MPVSHSHLRKQTAESMQTMLTSAVPDAVPVVAREPLLLHHRHPAPPKQQPAGDAGGGFPWLATAGFGYLTFSSGMALHRSRGDPGAATFVVFAYADLVLLFCFLRMYERADPGSNLRDWLKLAVWLLTAALTLAFSYKVAAVMPPPAAALVWAMALATVAGGFAAFFCFKAPAPGEMELRSADTLQASPLFLSSRSISKHISGGTRWPPPSLDLSSLDAHTPIEHNRAASSPAATSVAIGVISP